MEWNFLIFIKQLLHFYIKIESPKKNCAIIRNCAAKKILRGVINSIVLTIKYFEC